jgi:hypothetical protein
MAGAFNGGKKGGETATDEGDDESGGVTPGKTKKGGKGGKGSKKRAAEEVAEDDEDVESPKKPKMEADEDED